MGISVVVLTLSPILAVAQSCGIYTYQDMWVDDNGNAVGENLSEGDASCGEYTAFANVTLTMLSGNSQSGYGSGSPFAEALAAASTSGEQGDGLLDGSNEVDFSCDSAFASFSLPFELDLAYSKSKWNNTYTTLLGGSVRCFVDSWFTADTTPPTCDPDYVDQHPLIVGQSASCWKYYDTDWLAFRFKLTGSPWKCFPLIPGQNAIGTDDAGVKSCTKL